MRFLLGVLIIVGSAPPFAGAQVRRLTLTPDLRIDATRENLPWPIWFKVGPHGQIAVIAFDDQTIRFYDSTGKKLGTFGRKGRGPGEFERIGRYGFLADTFWVSDAAQRRITFISPSLKVLRIVSLPEELNRESRSVGSVMSFGPAAIGRDGTVLGSALWTTQSPVTGKPEGESIVLATTLTGATKRKVIAQPDRSDYTFDAPGLSGPETMTIPMVYQPYVTFLDDASRLGYVTVKITSKTGGTYTVSMFKPTGDTIFSRMFPFIGVPIPARVADSVIANTGIDEKGKPYVDPKRAQRIRDATRPKMPPVYAPVDDYVLGFDGTTWVQLRETTEGRMVMILDAKGNQFASVLLPPKTRMMAASMTHLWVREIDADDLWSIVRYRVR